MEISECSVSNDSVFKLSISNNRFCLELVGDKDFFIEHLKYVYEKYSVMDFRDSYGTLGSPGINQNLTGYSSVKKKISKFSS